MPLGLLLFGWTANARTHWIGPQIGQAVASYGLMLAFNSIQVRPLLSLIPVLGLTCRTLLSTRSTRTPQQRQPAPPSYVYLLLGVKAQLTSGALDHRLRPPSLRVDNVRQPRVGVGQLSPRPHRCHRYSRPVRHVQVRAPAAREVQVRRIVVLSISRIYSTTHHHHYHTPLLSTTLSLLARLKPSRPRTGRPKARARDCSRAPTRYGREEGGDDAVPALHVSIISSCFPRHRICNHAALTYV